jgi:hypothetical protein
MRRDLFVLLLFLSVNAFSLDSYDVEYPAHSTDIMTFFNKEAGFLLKRYDGYKGDYNFYPWGIWSTGFYAPWDLSGITGLADVTAGLYFRLNDYLSIPLGITSIFEDSAKGVSYDSPSVGYEDLDFDLFINSGLIFHSRFGSIGAFVGYYYGYFKDKDEWTNPYDIYDSMFGWSHYDGWGYVTDSGSDSGVKYTIVPVLNTAEYPILGLFTREVDGYFGMDRDDILNWAIKIVSRPFDLGEVTFSSLVPYYAKENYNLEAKNEIYGLRMSVMINNFKFSIDSGYRHYFDIRGNVLEYDDSPFFRFNFPIDDYGNGDWFGLTFYFDKTYLVPKIGVFANLFGNPVFGEIALYPHLFLAAGFKFIPDGT